MTRAAVKKASLCFCRHWHCPRVHATWIGLIAGPLSACRMHRQGSSLQNWSTHSEQPWQVQSRLCFFIAPFIPLPPGAGGQMLCCREREGALTSIITPCVCFPSTKLLLGAACQLHPALHKCHKTRLQAESFQGSGKMDWISEHLADAVWSGW